MMDGFIALLSNGKGNNRSVKMSIGGGILTEGWHVLEFQLSWTPPP